MKERDEEIRSIDQKVFQRLLRRYLLALGAIALIILLSQGLIQTYLSWQVDDSRVVNVAGRQRMLSQAIVKDMLILASEIDDEVVVRNRLKNNLDLWETSQEGLISGNDSLGLPGQNTDIIISMFQQIQPEYQSLRDAAYSFLEKDGDRSENRQTLQVVVDDAQQFLVKMDAIVFQYDREAHDRVVKLRRTELALLLLSLLILFLELFFIFRPTAQSVRQTIKQLLQREAEAKKMTQEIEALYKEKEQSHQELRAINFAVDQAALFASATTDGKVLYMSQKFKKLLGITNHDYLHDLPELMTTNTGEQQFLRERLKVTRSQIWNEELSITTEDGRKLWLEVSVVPVNRSGVAQDLLILCSDITSRKEAQIEIERRDEEKFKREVRQQKERSVQIVEAQEEERKRIARDIHDGIGQMLTSLKFNLESVNLDQPEKASDKLVKLKSLTTDLIRGVRMATFNLTPPELTDHGIAPSLMKLAQQLSKLTGKQILFKNQTDFAGRFNSIVETNLYRITQEAVNNAIKYADSQHVLIRLSHNKDLLSIVVDDDGKGFDPLLVDQQSGRDEGSGMGLAFMRDRIDFIEGRLFIHSAPGEGTRITINLPMTQEILDF